MDNDLISRSALLEALENDRMIFKSTITVPEALLAQGEHWRHCLEAAPAVDAVPVVRCTECQYMKIKAGLCYCKVWQGYNGMGDEGFCNYGERRDDGT